ncbi:DNA cytosine methyltransferase [Tardiphaga sp. 367_B4_N1_1]|uniref:DNA cytosine methyltransferase n=1 Tax=Tardiphaga sp. 367_B4_N1_1 TaxID=3240777 RepID=UPI003F246197
MTAYYNEIDPFAADWLRNLIAAGLIAPGDVDTRSIIDVRPDDLRSYTQCHFFAGIGGWSHALRSAGWDDARPVWTGSCPCQPFSLAGKQKGFDDARHLWPVWRELIRECDPAVVFGEQVASATEWLGLVRGDLEAMGRSVGAMPIQAASAGADHLRDRYWFVAHTPLPAEERQRRDSREILSDKTPDGRGGSGDMGNASSSALALRSIAKVERGDLRFQGAATPASGAGSISVADADQPCTSTERSERGGQLGGTGRDQKACDGRDVADTLCDGAGDTSGSSDSAKGAAIGIDGDAPWTRSATRIDGAGYEWVIGADGKARRVKPGIRLLAHGVSGRVGKLRGFGNAIDPRCGAAFIQAADHAMRASEFFGDQGDSIQAAIDADNGGKP